MTVSQSPRSCSTNCSASPRPAKARNCSEAAPRLSRPSVIFSKSKIQNLPVNVGGGLLGDGHPVGATGVRQVVEAYQHLIGTAGARQIAGAKRFLTCNIGGSLTTTVVMIWEAA